MQLVSAGWPILQIIISVYIINLERVTWRLMCCPEFHGTQMSDYVSLDNLAVKAFTGGQTSEAPLSF